jgi:hypothetical protein
MKPQPALFRPLAVARAFVLASLFATGSAPAAEADGGNDNVVGASAVFAYATNRMMDLGQPGVKEGAAITIDYRWEMRTLLGEPILKCNAAWTLDGVFVRRKPNAGIV